MVVAERVADVAGGSAGRWSRQWRDVMGELAVDARTADDGALGLAVRQGAAPGVRLHVRAPDGTRGWTWADGAADFSHDAFEAICAAATAATAWMRHCPEPSLRSAWKRLRRELLLPRRGAHACLPPELRARVGRALAVAGYLLACPDGSGALSRAIGPAPAGAATDDPPPGDALGDFASRMAALGEGWQGARTPARCREHEEGLRELAHDLAALAAALAARCPVGVAVLAERDRVLRWQVRVGVHLDRAGGAGPGAAAPPTDTPDALGEVELREVVLGWHVEAVRSLRDALRDATPEEVGPAWAALTEGVTAWSRQRAALLEAYRAAGVPEAAWAVARPGAPPTRALDLDHQRLLAVLAGFSTGDRRRRQVRAA